MTCTRISGCLILLAFVLNSDPTRTHGWKAATLCVPGHSNTDASCFDGCEWVIATHRTACGFLALLCCFCACCWLDRVRTYHVYGN